MNSDFFDYKKVSSGKVRDIYEVDDTTLLLVASDRISAFDYILENDIPYKGSVLTALSLFFFERLGFPNHLAAKPNDIRIPESLLGRAILVKKLKMLPVECVVSGYLTGSGLEDYRKTGSVGGNKLPSGLIESSKLKEPIFTPATKVAIGGHDENIDFEQLKNLVGNERAQQLRKVSLELYSEAAQIALQKNIILADTKLEFGIDSENNLILADEVFTPDSSRYWDGEKYQPGRIQISFDKQFVRNWLLNDSGWDKNSGDNPPRLPDEIVNKTSDLYLYLFERLTGSPLKVK